MSTFWNMYKAERKYVEALLSFFFFFFERKKKNKLRVLKCVFEIEKMIMQNNLDKDFEKWLSLKNNICMIGIFIK